MRDNFVDAIAAGDKNRMLIDRLQAEETRREELVKELAQLETIEQVSSLDEARLKREIKARLADVRGLLGRQVSEARRILRTFLEHPLRCEAVRKGYRKEYRITGTGTYLPLLPERLKPLNSPRPECSLEHGVPNGNRQTREHPLSFTIGLLVEAA